MTIVRCAPAMKRARNRFQRSIVLAAAFAALMPVAGHAGWDWLNPRPTPYELWSVSFGNAQTGVLVGDGGLVMTTSDGGVSWTPRDSGVALDNSLYRVHFVDSTTVIAAGGHIGVDGVAYGTVVRSSDAGATWTPLGDPVPNLLFSDASFRDANHGTAVGGDFSTFVPTVSRTSDGGATWSTQTFGYTGYFLGVAFPKPNVGFAVGYDFVQSQAIFLHTNDGGDSWAPTDITTSQVLNDVKFAGAEVGVAVGNAGTLFTTADGGMTWHPRDAGTSLDLHGVGFIGSDTVVVTGGNYLDQGVVLSSTDGGATWSSQLFDRSLNGAFFGNADSGTAVGSGGEMLHTSNGGQSWDTEQESVSTQGLFGVAFVDTQTGTAVGAGGTIVRTKDGGQTWRTQSSGTGTTLIGVAAADENNLMAVGGDITVPNYVIVSTTDGGVTWINRTPPDIFVPMRAVACPAAGVCTAVGYCGKIIHTDDGGANWITQIEADCTALADLNSVEFQDVENGIAVGASGVIAHTSDGGATWEYQAAPTDQGLNGIAFVDAHNGFIAGGGQADRGTILTTSDGGATWSVQREDIPTPVQSVAFATRNDGVAVTLGGDIYRTYDGGVTWSLDTHVIANLYGAVHKDSATAIVVGFSNNNAAILGWSDRVFANGFDPD